MKTKKRRIIDKPWWYIDWAEEYKVLSIFKNKSGYRVVLYEMTLDSFKFFRIVVSSPDNDYIPWIDSTWETDKELSYYVKDVEGITKSIKNKTTRRYFLRTIREFPMYNKKLGDYMKGDKINWEKVKDYEKTVLPKDYQYI